LFHWHCEDLGIRHVYIKKASPHLNAKVERLHLTDQRKFYQLIEYTDDIDILKKLEEWENFYNYHRPNAALKGKTPNVLCLEKNLPKPDSFFFSPAKSLPYNLSTIVLRRTLKQTPSSIQSTFF